MSWTEIKHAVNSTLGTSGFKPLDTILTTMLNTINTSLKALDTRTLTAYPSTTTIASYATQVSNGPTTRDAPRSFKKHYGWRSPVTGVIRIDLEYWNGEPGSTSGGGSGGCLIIFNLNDFERSFLNEESNEFYYSLLTATNGASLSGLPMGNGAERGKLLTDGTESVETDVQWTTASGINYRPLKKAKIFTNTSIYIKVQRGDYIAIGSETHGYYWQCFTKNISVKYSTY